MMNTLRRKTSARANSANSRPSLLSFRMREPSNLSKDCQALRNIQNTHPILANTDSQYCTNTDIDKPHNIEKHYKNIGVSQSQNIDIQYTNIDSNQTHVTKHYIDHEFDGCKEDTWNINIKDQNKSNKRDKEDYYYREYSSIYNRSRQPVHNSRLFNEENLNSDLTYAKELLYEDNNDGRSHGKRQRSFSQVSQFSGYPSSQISQIPKQSNMAPDWSQGNWAPQHPTMGGVARTVGGVVKRRKHVVLLGLDGSGKTTILMRLKYRCYVATAPTVGFNHEKVWGGGFRWSAWDVGGGERLRPLWGTYTRGTDALVFVVDAAASADTMEEARLEITRMLKMSKATSVQLGKVQPPLLVMANFQDSRVARCAPEVAQCLGLPMEGQNNHHNHHNNHNNHNNNITVSAPCWAVACVCGLTGEGLDEAMATLRHLIDSGGGATTTNRAKAKPIQRWR